MDTTVKIKVLDGGKHVKEMYGDINDFLKRAFDDDAGADIRAAISGIIMPMQTLIVPTGFAMQLEPGWEAQVRPRSGLAIKNGITVLNSPGTVDADYRAEVGVIITNLGDKPFSWSVGDRIAQMVICKVPKVKFEFADELDDTDRGEAGFGSTGV